MAQVRTASARGAGHDCDVLVVGGGIVGLSTAYAITRAAPGTRVTVLEKEPGPARHQTGRNSGVIHSGVYYRPGSLKARYAVRGAAEMVKFCAEYGIPHAVTGKLIVATERAELPRLHALVQRARENGIPVRELGAAQIPEHEPEVRAWPPSTSAPPASATTWPWPGSWRTPPARRSATAQRCGTSTAAPASGSPSAPAPGTCSAPASWSTAPGCTATRSPASPATTPACGSSPSGASTTSWRARSWSGAWCTRCRTRRSPSSACI